MIIDIKYILACFIAIFVFAGCTSQQDFDNGKVSVTGIVKTIKHEPMVLVDKGTVKIVKIRNEDIDGDGKAERIEYSATDQVRGVQNVTLKVNELEISLIAQNPSLDLNILEINTRDKLKVIEVFEEGSSDDSKSTLFIYDGKSIKKIGELLTDEYKFDGQSKIWTPLDTISLLEPNINIGWTEMNNKHQLNYRIIDKNLFINKRYKISAARDSDNNPWRIYITAESSPYGEDYIATVRKGDEVTLIDIVKQGGRDIALKVNLGDGKEGWIIHFLGGD